MSLFKNPVKKIQKSKKMVILKPAEPSIQIENELEEVLSRLFKALYRPIAKILVQENVVDNQNQVLNSQEDLIREIKNNRLLYDGNGFVYTNTYRANTRITKELQRLGAIFNNIQKKWFVPVESLPFEITSAINKVQVLQNTLTNRLTNYINGNNLNVFLLQEFKTSFKDVYYKLINDVISQSKNNLTEEGISINLKFDKQITEQIAQDYTNNLDLYIKNFTERQIQDLRQIINDNVSQGLRKEMLIEKIQDRFNVSKTKAKFLARQETSLLTSNIQKQNMQRAGIEYYMWDSSRDSRVRPDHAELNNKIFRFDNPPVVNKKTGARANAGEDFGCRCVQRPVIVNIENLRPFYENGYTYYKFVS